MSRLSVALLVGAAGPRAWHEQVVTTLAEHEAIDLACVYRTSGTTRSPGPVWRLLDRLETAFAHRLFRTKRADGPLPPEVSDSIPDAGTIDAIAGSAADVDLLIDLDGGASDRNVPFAPKHGVWHLTFDGSDGPADRIGIAGWYEGRHVIEATLWRRDARGDEAIPIEHAFLGTFKNSWSVNRSRHLWRVALLITDNAVRLATSEPAFADRAGPEAATTATSALPHPFVLGLRTVQRLARHVWQKLAYVEQWQVLAKGSAKDMLEPQTYARLEPPRDRFWADPFAVRRKDRDYIFVEELRYKADRGEIAVLEYRDGKLLGARTIIAEPYHMSYPCIIEHDGELYMVPETREKRSIDIWKNTSFPDRWTRISALLENVSAVDTTLFRHDGRWWMFTNLSRTRHLRSADELHAFYTDEASPVTQAWTPHPMNPLVRDTRCARQGGRVFTDDHGRLIRSAQDTAVRYGYAVMLFHVETLTPTGFAETLLHKIEPDWHVDVVGMHTFERQGDLCVFDACFLRSRLRMPL